MQRVAPRVARRDGDVEDGPGWRRGCAAIDVERQCAAGCEARGGRFDLDGGNVIERVHAEDGLGLGVEGDPVPLADRGH